MRRLVHMIHGVIKPEHPCQADIPMGRGLQCKRVSEPGASGASLFQNM